MSAAAERLSRVVLDGGPWVVAVSGGVDSLTLAVLIHRRAGQSRAVMVHAVSPAVPPKATERVRAWSEREGWRLLILDAGEFDDPDYRRNPLNRCFFCKHNLYAAIASRVEGRIASGTNVDDLGEYRPGLDAARDFAVRHPYVEAEMDKAGVRALARELGLGDVAELPAAPCLSSRIETLIPIDPETLRSIDSVEEAVRSHMRPATVRCRVRAAGIVIELDGPSLAALVSGSAGPVEGIVRALLPASLAVKPISFSAYRAGSAFVVPEAG